MNTKRKLSLEKDRILRLLAESDTKWFINHPGPMNYREHLEFTAEYIAKNYNKEAKK
ncbi:MAG: hypothetical protein Q8O55_11290 [Dehalococcoidales bacterium]|nr:hypothetical protein [Dehalococcoidales bacterium]